ncbi:WecB/TagA/CpsF family glycosyltransferase, partial [candidate division KSB1 bacterium]|nr:WecB/TagA/CpsF family glycosyltransferase [candidate division KSB1 bacterium]
MSNIIRERYPQALIVGKKSPPFRPFTGAENAAYLAEIAASEADIIWVSLGAPKQEIWIYDNYRHFKRGLFVGIGAGFSYLAGEIKHAPHWMKSLALEWLYRLIQEPFRLFGRYLVSNSLFLYYISREFLYYENNKSKNSSTQNRSQRF